MRYSELFGSVYKKKFQTLISIITNLAFVSTKRSNGPQIVLIHLRAVSVTKERILLISFQSRTMITSIYN